MTGALVSSLLNGGSGSGGVSTKKVIIKSATLPTASEKTLGAMYIYAGEDTTDLKHGYIYEGRSIAANTKEVEFSTNTISCSGADFWELVKTLAPSNYTEIVKGEMVLVGGNTWRIVGRNTNDEQVLSYQQYDADFEAAGFVFNGTFSEGDTVPFVCEINEMASIQYVWRRIDVQPSSSKGQVIAVDAELSPTSENPVQNKAIAGALGVDWVKPDDWVDIRSGALPNSIYFLIGHSSPVWDSANSVYTVSSYNQCPVGLLVENSGTYDVYIDGLKVFSSVTQETVSVINWADLYTAKKVETIYTTTHPSELVTHVVRLTPTNSSNHITRAITLPNGYGSLGVLWVHFNTSKGISNLSNFGCSDNNSSYYDICEAITSNNGVLKLNNISSNAFRNCGKISTVPTFDLQEATSLGAWQFLVSTHNIKTIKLTNLAPTEGYITGTNYFNEAFGLEKIECNVPIRANTSMFTKVRKLKKLPAITFKDLTSAGDCITEASALEETQIDASDGTKITRLGIHGTSTYRMNGVNSITVSAEAPFDNATAPQLNVSYTGLSRAALVNLFKSMPYNVGYEVIGSPTIVDGVVSGFSGDDFLQISLQVAPQNITEFVAKIKINAAAIGSGRYHNIFYGPSSSSMVLFGGEVGAQAITTVACYLPGAADSLTWVTANLVADTWYWFKYTYDGTTVKLYCSTDGINYGAEKVSKTATINGNTGTRNIGNRWSGDSKYFDGEIDLNETYIKVNGIPWFTGKAAMTKTCSVVGCTGTADLTQDDKNIALNKGWSLTVA